MARVAINTGATPNDGTGDSLRAAGGIINNNFLELYTYLGAGTTDTLSAPIWNTNASGINTSRNVGLGTTNPRFALEVGSVGASGTSLWVNGNARITGILTIGTSSITLDGSTNTINVGSGITINGNTGIISVTSIVVGGSTLTGSGVTSITAGSGISVDQSTGNVTISATGGGGGSSSQWVTTAAGIHTLSNVGIGTTNPTSALTVTGNGIFTGIVTANTFVKYGGTSSQFLKADGSVDTATYATQTYVGLSTVGLASVSYVNSQIGLSTVGLASVSYVNSQIGLSTSGLLSSTGNGSTLTGIVTFITAGSGITINQSTGNVIVTANGTSSQWVTTGVGIHTLSNVGIGTTNPQGTLQVGTGITMYGSTGIISATTFVGNFSGSITDATNLTGGYANASQLNVSGVATVSQGRIQVDAASNLRFGNLAAGSGSGRNIAIGDQVLISLSGGSGRNIGIGELSYYDTTTGQYNIGVGIQAGQKITTGSYNVIIGGYNGQTGLDIRTSSNNVVIADGQGNIRQYINSIGNVGIKTTIITEALTVAGIVSATSFYGTLNASQLTGALPALDGSALTGVTATGTGVEIREDGTPVGTASTIDFGTNISVSFASGIATVSGASSVSNATTAYNLAGTPNLNVGIVTATSFNGPLTGGVTGNVTGNVSGSSATAGYATTAGISSAVSGTININTTGIITASSFSGSGSGLTNLPSGQLTGALPALDGSALINLPAQPGDGVNVRDDNNPVGSARTVNFGTGLDVAISGGIATITASGGSLQSRTTVSGVTTSIANNGIGNTNITGFKSYALMRVGLSTAGWLRLYTDSTSRANDVSRSVGVDPSPGSGVIAEVVTTGISTTQIISPFVMGGNLDNPADTTIYAAITNLSGTTQAITANLTILQLEA